MPNSLPWSDSFEVGIPVLDDDHRCLVAAINAFCDAEAAGASRAILLGHLDRLSELAEDHFEREEAVVALIQEGKLVPKGAAASAEGAAPLLGALHSEAHDREHEVRLEQLDAVRSRVEDRVAHDPEKPIGPALINWFVQQTVGFDGQIRAFFLD